MAMKKFVIFVMIFTLILATGCVNSSQDLTQNNTPSIDEIIGENTTPETPPIIIPPLDEEEEEQKKKYLISTTNSLRIRSGAGDSYSVVGYLDKNDGLVYQGKVGNYYKTTFKEKTAYVHSSYINVIEVETGSEQTEKAIDFGMKLMGYPYVWGAQRYHWGNGKLNTNFKNGEFDCSALVQYVYYKSNSVILDVTSRAQSLNGVLVDKSDLRRGDLMFFTNSSRKDMVGIERIGHVGIYFGNNYILHTASDHAVLEPISSLRWSYYVCARRVV